MAIYHAQPLLLPLLLSLFFVPAALQRARREFRLCPNSTPRYDGGFTRVYVDPYPVVRGVNVDIILYSFRRLDISDGATVQVNVSASRFERQPQVFTKTFPICDTVPCPIVPGYVHYNISNAFITEELKEMLNTVKVSIIVEQEPIVCIMFTCQVNDHLT